MTSQPTINSDGLYTSARILTSLMSGEECLTAGLVDDDLPGATEAQELGYSSISLDLFKAIVKTEVLSLPTPGDNTLLNGGALHLSGTI